MENAWGEFDFPYVGDSLAFFHTFVHHMNHLKKLFQRLREKEIKVTAYKCKLFQRQVNYLGMDTRLIRRILKQLQFC